MASELKFNFEHNMVKCNDEINVNFLRFFTD